MLLLAGMKPKASPDLVFVLTENSESLPTDLGCKLNGS